MRSCIGIERFRVYEQLMPLLVEHKVLNLLQADDMTDEELERAAEELFGCMCLDDVKKLPACGKLFHPVCGPLKLDKSSANDNTFLIWSTRPDENGCDACLICASGGHSSWLYQ